MDVMDQNAGSGEPLNDIVPDRNVPDAITFPPDDISHWGVECALEFVQMHCSGWRHVDAIGGE